MSRGTVRPATAADVDQFLALVDALADYEKLARPDAGARERIVRDAFGPSPRITVWFAEVDGTAVGYALFFETYSSFLARPTLYLEDLFVRPEFRGGGHGIRLVRALAGEALRRGCARMEWTVLKWNRVAIDFYDRLGAMPMDGWQTYRLDGARLAAVAAE